MQPKFWGVFHSGGCRSVEYGGDYHSEDLARAKAKDAAAKFPGNSYEVRELVTVPAQTLKDMKSALNSGVKPDITHVRTPTLNYIARASEYGNAKGYERANYIRETAGPADDFNRLRAYLRANVSHTIRCLDMMERHQANDPKLTNVEGMRAACFAPDTDVPDHPVGPSMLPHLCGAVASLNMALEQAVNAGLLPEDPGQPWKAKSNGV